MLLQLSLLHLVIFLHLPQPISSFSNPVAKNGCPDRCGNLTIPYPFGVGSGCCRSESFNITCNTSTHPPKPMLYINPLIEVLEITSSQIRIKNPYLLNTACYDESGNLNGSYEGIWYEVDWSQTQYTFSDENWLTAVGCDDLVLGTGKANKSFGGGCVAYCASAGMSGGTGFCVNNDNGYSPGNGCCRTPIPRARSDEVAASSDEVAARNDEVDPRMLRVRNYEVEPELLRVQNDEVKPELQFKGPVTRLRAKKLQAYLQVLICKQFEDLENARCSHALVNLLTNEDQVFTTESTSSHHAARI